MGRAPGSIVLAEILRWSWPFGGVPLASFAISQAVSPIAFVVRVGGAPLLVMLVVIIGVTISAAWNARGRRWPSVPQRSPSWSGSQPSHPEVTTSVP